MAVTIGNKAFVVGDPLTAELKVEIQGDTVYVLKPEGLYRIRQQLHVQELFIPEAYMYDFNATMEIVGDETVLFSFGGKGYMLNKAGKISPIVAVEA